MGSFGAANDRRRGPSARARRGTEVLRRVLLLVAVFAGLATMLHVLDVYLSPDSVEYVAMARSLAQGQGLLGFDGEPAGLWTPGFSAALAPWLRVGVDPVAWAPWWNAALWTLLLAFVARHLLRQEVEAAWRAPVAAAFLVGAPLSTVFTALLADSMLLVVLLTGLVLAEKVVTPSGGGRSLAALLALGALAPVVKPIGLALWPAVLFATVAHARRRRHPLLLLVLLPVPLPFALWVVRNLELFGRVAERFPGAPRDLGATLRRTFEWITRWVVPQLDSTDVLLICGAVLFVGALVLARRRGAGGPSGRELPWILTAVTFVALLWSASAVQKIDLPNHRLLAPLYLIVVVLVARAGSALQRSGGHRGRLAALALLWTVWIVWQGVDGARRPLFGYGLENYEREGALGRELRALVETAPEAHPVWSNVPEFVHWQTGREAQWTEEPRLRGVLASEGEPVLLVWFSRSLRDGLLDARELDGRVQWQEHITGPGFEAWRGVVAP